MPCFHPIKAYPGRERAASGGYKYVFNAKDALIENAGGHREFPCQKCIGCRIDRSRDWAIRAVHEASMHDLNCFLTLTYANEHLPQDFSLDITAYQQFLKRLRSHVGSPIKFFGCGEYGDQDDRPHYHFLIFGWRPSDLKLHTEKNGIKTYTSEKLGKLWPYGFNTVGELTYKTAAYCARYILKKKEATSQTVITPASILSLGEFVTSNLSSPPRRVVPASALRGSKSSTTMSSRPALSPLTVKDTLYPRSTSNDSQKRRDIT